MIQELLLRVRATLVTTVTIALSTGALAQATVVTGTGSPDIDVPAVQAAVNLGGDVVLRGYFSFETRPTISNPLQAVGFPQATILISKAVAISGAADATIERGTIPFSVVAPGASVTIQNIHFVRPSKSAIVVYAVSGLVIASCRIDGYVPLPKIAFSGIGISTSDMAAIPTPSQPGHPENISGTILIANNEIDAGENPIGNVLGIATFSAGQSPDKEVDLFITGNRIKNVTMSGINLRRVSGRARVEGNVITTGPVSSGPRPEAIRAVNIGSYVIAHNVIRCQWPDSNAVGIGVFSQTADWPMANAIVIDNEVNMLPPDGVIFGNYSAGIDIRGFARGNVVGNNIIRGRARAAVAVDVFNSGVPRSTAFVLNRFDALDVSVADVIVGNGIKDTLILGQEGTVDDRGTNTVIMPFGGRPGSVELALRPVK
jgi:hypothetical protein